MIPLPDVPLDAIGRARRDLTLLSANLVCRGVPADTILADCRQGADLGGRMVAAQRSDREQRLVDDAGPPVASVHGNHPAADEDRGQLLRLVHVTSRRYDRGPAGGPPGDLGQRGPECPNEDADG